MKLSLASLAFTMGLIAQALTNPTPQVGDAIIDHCGGEIGAVCPQGWRCCGPLDIVTGGNCVEGLDGVCPF
ncbi:hypothetical protein D9619_006626 [Psilocybe cf. subviscida]|uniref:Hydrophobin n=1 Tax=Psilocybe cf. subviscida TaxID=2480587 RepID=A0A8H5B4X4_9AGAR|nr:hypothetical protein D9619_006626 [Psilocybe cf. subviscida]